ncbi:MAG: rhodanese-like domain-containing protein [Reichenbachiella sp.]|uniref:rhodanese-like domain-containing protein n=1 Tax=Reichenbachiella sp. TaxID=2184521 RepID=UPI0032636CF7
MKNSIFASILVLVGFCMMLSSCTAQINERLSAEEFKEMIENESDDFVIMDVRTDEEIALGKLIGAQQVNFRDEDFEEQLKQLDKELTYYVYCAAGGRSGKAAAKMSELGFAKVYDLKGGINAWREQGYDLQ